MPVNPPTTTSWLLLPLAIMGITTTASLVTVHAGAAVAAAAPAMSAADLADFLHTENVLIENLENYIERFAWKVGLIKRKALEIRALHEAALNDTERYLNNPLNAVRMLKRFTSDWSALRAFAADGAATDEIVRNVTELGETLRFPTEADYDDAVGRLLRIQDVYHLEPSRLALGRDASNGIKFGTEMSWSDCFEIGRRSDGRGEHAIAKFWLETALGKLGDDEEAPRGAAAATRAFAVPPVGGDRGQARFKTLEALLNAEYKLGNIEAAHELVDRMLAVNPTHKGVLKAKETIEDIQRGESSQAKKYLNKRAKRRAEQQQQLKESKTSKSDEELLIEEICREATFPARRRVEMGPAQGRCSLVGGNLPQLLLAPIKQELLSADPYIAVYHDVWAPDERLEDLKNRLNESESDVAGSLRFAKSAERLLATLAQRLHLTTGHRAASFAEWRVRRRSFSDEWASGDDDDGNYDDDDGDVVDDDDDEKLAPGNKIVARLLINLQTARLGGSIVFPQLELSAPVPRGSALYWTNLDEFQQEDYRSKQFVCPVVAGTQISAVTSIRY